MNLPQAMLDEVAAIKVRPSNMFTHRWVIGMSSRALEMGTRKTVKSVKRDCARIVALTGVIYQNAHLVKNGDWSAEVPKGGK